MTIKGTLETFNLRELLQMLAFNQKVGTLVLDTDQGVRTVYLDRGRAALIMGDPTASRALLRVVRRRRLVDEERLQRPLSIVERSGRFLGDVLQEMGLLEEAARRGAWEEAFAETFLDLALTPIQRFEFDEGRCVSVQRAEAPAIEPAVAVEGLLLDLTRKLDQWAALQPLVPTMREIYEGTGIAVDLTGQEEIDASLAERMIPHFDGFHTLEAVSQRSDVDRLTAVQVTALMLQGGGLRAVPVEELVSRGTDLLSRGEAQDAVPVLRRAVEREGAPHEARLRLADALEACGERAQAAQELDTFTSLVEGGEHGLVFDALERALALRGPDLATAIRLCDHYLSNRPWLRDRRERAVDALRTLLHLANVEGRPLDGAHRLAEFIKVGDSPSEDLLVLADLHVAAGERLEAAAALFTRAQALLGEGRTPAARSLLARVLELDPSRSDARRQAEEMEGREERRRRKRRIALLVVLLVILVAIGGLGVLMYGRELDENIRRLREPAETAVAEVERLGASLLQEYEARVAAARTSEVPDAELTAAGTRLVEQVKSAVSGTQDEIRAFGEALLSFGPREDRASGAGALEHLQARVTGLLNRSRTAVQSVREESEAALITGEKAYASGRFREARKDLLVARNLGGHDPVLPARATQLLAHVDRYVQRCEETVQRMAALVAEGRVAESYQLGVALLSEQADSDVTKEVRLPVRVESDPPGAEVWVGGTRTTLRTPCVVGYSPFEASELRLRLPGRSAWSAPLPSYKAVRKDLASVQAWTPHLTATLPAGARFRLRAGDAPLGALWDSEGTPLVLSRDGVQLFAVDAGKGRLGNPIPVGLESPARRGGTFPGRLEWRMHGTRTLRVLTRAGASWEVQVIGSLDRAPAYQEGVVAAVDALGTVRGYEVTTGREVWRAGLPVAPAQQPWPSPLGLLLSAEDGSAWVVSARDGQANRLAPPGRRRLVLPLADGALLLGGGPGATRRLTQGGGETTLADRAPLADGPLAVTPRLVAWLEADGVYAFRPGDTAPFRVPGLGPAPTGLAADKDVLYGADAEGHLRAVDVDAPDQPLWEAPLGGRPESAPLPVGDAVFILVDGDVVCVER